MGKERPRLTLKANTITIIIIIIILIISIISIFHVVSTLMRSPTTLPTITITITITITSIITAAAAAAAVHCITRGGGGEGRQPETEEEAQGSRVERALRQPLENGDKRRVQRVAWLVDALGEVQKKVRRHVRACKQLKIRRYSAKTLHLTQHAQLQQRSKHVLHSQALRSD